MIFFLMMMIWPIFPSKKGAISNSFLNAEKGERIYLSTEF